jgi:hypothetical protein
MTETTFNMNDYARVRLTQAGIELVEKYERQFDSSMPEHLRGYVKQPEMDGSYKFRLWELMHIFGPVFYLGNFTMPFEDNNLIIGEAPIIARGS